jgi:hypothetical protein
MVMVFFPILMKRDELLLAFCTLAKGLRQTSGFVHEDEAGV